VPAMEDRAGSAAASASAGRSAAMAERVALRFAMGVSAAPAATPPPPLGIAEGRRSKAAEDDENDSIGRARCLGVSPRKEFSVLHSG
jgi:hypothetical protein